MFMCVPTYIALALFLTYVKVTCKSWCNIRSFFIVQLHHFSDNLHTLSLQKKDPAQFLQVHGRAYKIHLDPAVALAAESPINM